MDQIVKPFNEVAYIHTDLDGAGCSILYRLTHYEYTHNGYTEIPESDDTWRLFNVDNHEIDSLVMTHLKEGRLKHTTKIIFGDICAKKHVLMKLKERGIECVQILDHHKTNLVALDVYPNGVVWVPMDENEPMQSGTSVMYDYYMKLYGGNLLSPYSKFPFNGSGSTKLLLNRFVNTIRSYDTYEWKETGNIQAKQLQVLFQLLGMDRFCNKYLDRFTKLNDDRPMISDNDMEFVSRKIEIEEKTINEFSPNDVYDISYNKKLGALVLSTKGANINELANTFLTKNPEYDFMVGFDLSRSGSFSFRSTKDNIDLGKDFAGQIGGGGHPKAAGAVVKVDLIDRIVDILYDYLSEHGRIDYGH